MTTEISRALTPTARHDEELTESGSATLRLLPWTTEAGGPCYLSGAENGFISRFADDVEDEQTSLAEDALTEAKQLLVDQRSAYEEVRNALVHTAECLSNILRIAESRAQRLPMLDYEPSGDE